MGPKASRPFLFLTGCPRSGTYLLSAILNRSGRIAIPRETHFIPLFPPFLRLAGAMDQIGSRQRLTRAIFMFTRIWSARAGEEHDSSTITRHSLLTVEPEAGPIADDARDYADIVRGLFAAYADRQGAEMAGDKSAYFNHVPLDRLDASTGGDARFIHIIRDGRDVAVSWMGIEFGPRTLPRAASA